MVPTIRLELIASALRMRRSAKMSYVGLCENGKWWAVRDLNPAPTD